MKKIISLIIIILFSFTLFVCVSNDEVFIPTDDEIALHIKLDTEEDIGLLIVDYDANGSKGSGGTSNANKSMLKHDETIIHTINKQELDNQTNLDNMEIKFTIITKYTDPNFENIYPKELTKTMEPIYLNASYGKSYFITITGDKENGYKAILNS